MRFRRASIRELISQAYELDGHTLQGVIRRDAEGRWMVGTHSLDDVLARYEGHEVALIYLDFEDERPMEKKICRTCGREYQGTECPVCREARIRLRGRSER